MFNDLMIRLRQEPMLRISPAAKLFMNDIRQANAHEALGTASLLHPSHGPAKATKPALARLTTNKRPATKITKKCRGLGRGLETMLRATGIGPGPNESKS